MSDKGHIRDTRSLKNSDTSGSTDNFVLEKGIFSNIFEKDIRRVYIYKKTERLAKAIHLISPAFTDSPALRNRVDAIAVGLIDAALMPPVRARGPLSRELLALASMLSIARSGGILSPMNADLITREAQLLLQEVAGYEEPRLFLDESPTLAALFKSAEGRGVSGVHDRESARTETHKTDVGVKDSKGQLSDKQAGSPKPGRRDAVLSVLRTKGPSYIKDISTVIRDVSEKTIQRELSLLVLEGLVEKRGERRWTTYTLVG